MQLRHIVVGVFAVSSMAVGCGGMPEDSRQDTVNAVENQDIGTVEQHEYWRLGAQQTGDYSAWLFGSTPWRIYNYGSVAIPFSAWCGDRHFSATIAAGGMHEGSLMCNWFGARLYIKNESYDSKAYLDAYTY